MYWYWPGDMIKKFQQNDCIRKIMNSKFGKQWQNIMQLYSSHKSYLNPNQNKAILWWLMNRWSYNINKKKIKFVLCHMKKKKCIIMSESWSYIDILFYPRYYHQSTFTLLLEVIWISNNQFWIWKIKIITFISYNKNRIYK